MKSVLALLAVALLVGVPSLATADTATVTVSINSDNYNGNAGVALQMTATASSPGHTIQSVSWNFGDANCNNSITNRECTTTGTSVTHIFTSDATYTITVTAVDNHGNSGTDTANAIIANADTTAPTIAAPTGGFVRTGTAGSAVQVDATITDNVGATSAILHYARDTDSDGTLADEQDQTATMSQTGGANNWRGSIPSSAVSGLVGYYIEALDGASNTVRNPAVGTANAAQAGNVPQILDTRYIVALADTLPPVITAVSGSVITVSADGASIPVRLTITDGSALATTTLFYRQVGQTTFPTTQAVTTPTVSGTTYTFNVPVSTLFTTATSFQYYAQATDSAASPNTATLPATNPTTSPSSATINRLPTVTHTAIGDSTITSGSGLSVSSTVTDDRGLASVVLNVRKGTSGAFTAVTMSSSGSTYSGAIPSGLLSTSGTVQYYLVATDSDGAVLTHPSSAPTTPLSFGLTVNQPSTTTNTGNTGNTNTGNTNTGSSSAVVADTTAPTISAFGPTGNVTTNPPTITASYSDNVGVVVATLVLTLDGGAVVPTATTTGLSFTPAAPLTLGEHTVALTVKDAANNIGTLTWTFNLVAATTGTTGTTTNGTSTTVTPSTPARVSPTPIVSPIVPRGGTPTGPTDTTTTDGERTPTLVPGTPTSKPGETPGATKDEGGGVPGFEVVALLAALGVALLMLRRR